MSSVSDTADGVAIPSFSGKELPLATSETNLPSVEIPTSKAVKAKSLSEKGLKMAARARELKMRKRKAHRQRIRAHNAKG